MKKELKDSADAFYAGTKTSRRFAEEVMIPRLRGLLKPTPKEQTIISIYSRMFLWLNTVTSLTQIRCFQGAAAGSRAIFELLLDLKLIIENNVSDSVEKYFAFTTIEQARVANQIIDFFHKNKSSSQPNLKPIEDFIMNAGRKDKIEALILKYWGKDKKGLPKKISHWSGMNVADRARKLGGLYYEFYIRSYPIFSWQLHSAAGAGYLNVDFDYYNAVFASSHRLILEMFTTATELVAKEFHFDKADPEFSKWIKKLRMIPGLELLRKEFPNLNPQELLNQLN